MRKRHAPLLIIAIAVADILQAAACAQANPWEEALVRQVTQHGGEVVSDTYITHNMSFDSLTNLFEARMCTGYPCRAVHQTCMQSSGRASRQGLSSGRSSLLSTLTTGNPATGWMSPCICLRCWWVNVGD